MVSVSPRSQRGGATTGAALGALAAALLLAGTLSACSGDSPAGSPQSREAALEVRLASGTGSLDAQERSRIQNAVTDVLSKYVLEAFLGDYPREDFVQAFDAFTPGAARGAARDIDLLTGARFSDTDGLHATKLLAQIACLTDGDDVIGATAHVDFAFQVKRRKGRPPGGEPPWPVHARGERWRLVGLRVRRGPRRRRAG